MHRREFQEVGGKWLALAAAAALVYWLAKEAIEWLQSF
jgi:hypothetical protein